MCPYWGQVVKWKLAFTEASMEIYTEIIQLKKKKIYIYIYSGTGDKNKQTETVEQVIK